MKKINKKAAFEITTLLDLIKYLAIGVILILIIIFLGRYLLTEVDIGKIFRVR